MAAHGRRTQGDTRLIAALLEGQTLKAAAAVAGLSEHSARRRLQEPGFRAQLQAARQEALAAAITHLVGATTTASAGLERLAAHAQQEAIRFAACRAILELALRGCELLDLDARLAALEERLSHPVPRTNGRIHHVVHC